jgi:hypothetical protein
MANVTYDRQLTALLVVDPFNEACLVVGRGYGVQHHRYPLGSIVHHLPVR